jgi:hypothetical protein
VKNVMVIIAAGALTVGGVAACSSAPAPDAQQRSGTLPAGTAKVIINGQDAGTTTDVSCQPAESLTTISTGNQQAGATVLLSSDQALTVQAVDLRNLGGFTGSYNNGLGGKADVELIDRTYKVSGTADGFDSDNPSFRSSGAFSITVAC